MILLHHIFTANTHTQTLHLFSAAFNKPENVYFHEVFQGRYQQQRRQPRRRRRSYTSILPRAMHVHLSVCYVFRVAIIWVLFNQIHLFNCVAFMNTSVAIIGEINFRTVNSCVWMQETHSISTWFLRNCHDNNTIRKCHRLAFNSTFFSSSNLCTRFSTCPKSMNRLFFVSIKIGNEKKAWKKKRKCHSNSAWQRRRYRPSFVVHAIPQSACLQTLCTMDFRHCVTHLLDDFMRRFINELRRTFNWKTFLTVSCRERESDF